MASLIGIIIVVSGVVFGTTLIGWIAFDQFQQWIEVKNITCDCIADVDSDVYPWQVSLGKLSIEQDGGYQTLERLQLETHLCGGVLVNSRYVLISAHCLRFNYDEKLGIGFGSGDLIAIHNKGRIPIKRIIHSANNQIDDISLIELESEIEFGSETLVKPACFNRFSERIYEYNVDLVATGWNLIEKQFAKKDYFTINRYHSQSKFKDVSMQDNNCNRVNKICARAKDLKNCACYTDTGSPLHMLNQPNITTVIGLHQLTLSKETSNRTVGCSEIYFTRISSKLDFIQSVVKDQICLV